MHEPNGQGDALRAGKSGVVLIVDDTPTSAIALELACSGIPGMEVRSAPSAKEAARMLADGAAPLRAVLTDIRMPAMDGFELIHFIRSHSSYSAVPIVVVTADTDPETPERTLLLGANAFFGKPFSPRAVRRKLEELLNVDDVSE